MLPRKMRCSEIAPEAILGQKWSRSSYMAQRILHPIYEVGMDKVGRCLLAESCMNTLLFIVAVIISHTLLPHILLAS